MRVRSRLAAKNINGTTRVPMFHEGHGNTAYGLTTNMLRFLNFFTFLTDKKSTVSDPLKWIRNQPKLKELKKKFYFFSVKYILLKTMLFFFGQFCLLFMLIELY